MGGVSVFCLVLSFVLSLQGLYAGVKPRACNAKETSRAEAGAGPP